MPVTGPAMIVMYHVCKRIGIAVINLSSGCNMNFIMRHVLTSKHYLRCLAFEKLKFK